MERKTKNIALRVGEIADAYALESLYLKMQKEFQNENIYFSTSHRLGILREILEKYPVLKKGAIPSDYVLSKSKPDLVVMIKSDTTEDLARYEGGPYRTLCIGASILKAMRKLPASKELNNIKREYDLENKKKPLAVMGWLPYKEGRRVAKKLILSLIPKVHFVVTPDRNGYPTLKYMKFGENELTHITEIEGTGHLSKLHAIADISFSGWNLIRKGSRLNNFYEQSRGGPFFLVPPKNTKQYGYKDLVEQGLVRPCKNTNEVIEQSRAHLEELIANPVLKQKHRKKLLAHRNETRNEFLPEIFDRIAYLLRTGKEPKIFTYVHPESDWDGPYIGKDPTEIFGTDYKNKINEKAKVKGAA